MLANKTRSELLTLTKKFIPPLLPTYYKGQCGKIVVIGGCEDYTGAPFFAAHASAQLGCDLTHVICELGAGKVIKSYSPDLMVHPYLRDSLFFKVNSKGYSELEFLKKEVMPKVVSVLDKVQVVVVGPGFGRDELMLRSLEMILKEIKKRNLPVILDADALYLLSLKPELIKDYDNAIITPNLIEFKRIYDAVFKTDTTITSTTELDKVIKLSNYLNVTVLHKGSQDIIAFQNQHIINEDTGSNKRVGGQGDSLTGLISTLLAWGTSAYRLQIWPDAATKPILSDTEVRLLAVYGGCSLTKLSAKKAFGVYGRSMQTTDLHKFIYESYKELFDA